MYTSDLQQLLLHCCERSDLSFQTFEEFRERFNELRKYGHLPKGRDQRKNLLTPTQVASAILGLVPTRASYAGHGATVLKTLLPVGGQRGSFHNTKSLIEAVELILTDSGARRSLITLRVALGETGLNSNGGAIITYDYEGARRHTSFMPSMAASIMRDGVDLTFDFERQLFSSASREMRFGHRLFEDIAQAMELAAHNPGEPASDGSEYDDEEAKQKFWKKLGVTRRSRFLNMGADNHVTWPRDPTLVKFDNYHFVLMPRTKDKVQSVHMDLTANKLDEASATTVIRRFLSIMAWCDNNFATLGFGWSGNPVPVPVSKPDLAFRCTRNYNFDRKVPLSPKARRALALYREALNAEHSGLVSYAVLNYYKVIELTHPARGDTKKWLRDNFHHVERIDYLIYILNDFDKLRGTMASHEYIYKSCRNAVAHASKDGEVDPDDAVDLLRLNIAAKIMQVLARHHIGTEFNISDCMFDGT